MMRKKPLLSAVLLLGSMSSVHAQDADFHLTYHVERTPADGLSIDACGDAAVETARQAGFETDRQSVAGLLVTVQGGRQSVGAFVVQCIAVDAKTVSVVQGIDYQPRKGALGRLADQALAALRTATK